MYKYYSIGEDKVARLDRKERDSDGDGKIDVWERFNEAGEVIRTGRDTDGGRQDGRPRGVTPDSTFCVLLAGGIGSRLAPLSTPERPKQVLPLLPDGRSPLLATWQRVEPLFPPERVLVITGRPMERAVRGTLPQLPHDSFCIEPEGRNTLPALVWASAEVHRRGGLGLVSLHADHRVDD